MILKKGDCITDNSYVDFIGMRKGTAGVTEKGISKGYSETGNCRGF